MRLVELRLSQQLFEPCRRNRRIQLERSDRFLKEYRLPRFRLDHSEMHARNGHRHWQRWRSSAASQVDHPFSAYRNVLCGHQWLDQEAIDGVGAQFVQIERREVDLAIPGGKQPVVGFELSAEF